MKNCNNSFLKRVLISSMLLVGLSTHASVAAVISLNTASDGGAFNPSTDKAITIRNNGADPVKTTLGSAATQPSSAFIATGGSAGGDLSGTFPNPSVLKINGATPATVATTGVYSDLSGKPTLPASTSATASNFFSAYNATTGAFTKAQPAFSDISGQVAASQLPNPTGSSLGGVQSAAAVSHQFLTSITTLGVPTLAQPSFADLSGNISVSQINGGTGASSSTFLRGDGTWATPAGGGGSVSVTAGTPDIVINPSPGTGTFTVGSTNPVNTSPSATVRAQDMASTVIHTANANGTETLPAVSVTGFGAGAAFGDLNTGTGTLTRTNNSNVNGLGSTILHSRGWDFVISDGTQYYALGSPGFGTITANAMVKYTNDLSGATTAATANVDYQVPITLTTTGTSGAATFNAATGALNIPNNAGGGATANQNKRNISVVFDGNGSALTAGKVIYLSNIPYSGTITGVTMLSDASGSAVVDVWKVPYSSAPPTISNTITGSSLPALTTAQKYTDTTLSGWTTTVSAGDTMAFKLNSASTLTFLSVTLQVTAN